MHRKDTPSTGCGAAPSVILEFVQISSDESARISQTFTVLDINRNISQAFR